MVARIYPPAPFKAALNYNESKLKKGKAACIHAENFLSENKNLTFYDKLKFLERIISLNERAKNNGMHISLNFDPSEKIGEETLTAIALEYMNNIGFGDQPYLVYQHNDAGHPHIHIVSTLIRTDGKRIDIHNLGRTLSEKARKEIEKDFGLVKATDKKKIDLQEIKSINIQKALYGKSETKQSISNILYYVMNNYKFTSIPELNAVLKQYNVVADRGNKDSRVFNYGGVNYYVLDEKGKKVGVPIKASLFYFKPTLKNLERIFAENEIKRQPDKQKLKNAIDWILAGKPKNLDAFIQKLKEEKIQTVARQNEQGLIYGITYIDYRTKSIFNGSDVGKQYSAKGILEKLGVKQEQSPLAASDIHNHQENNHFVEKESEKNISMDIPQVLQILLDPTEEKNYTPYELRQDKKKKKRSQSNHL